ncbi:hypothetical protein [Pedobacter heparinus]|uniref:Uncharacterized protein n=1 Tax=Pedobacter heparinus (strain ATCC 13125 / DSM 2366 / CIP 104194 / JCM 7457 / NBRC 12017 / NCIMB 9290 / NRRL B-14731 / HIM 762-3) TaxID=485917 RepID=C6Y2S4_PEDHD|nr:hypothetical protein [Pedobacter heparinus]ACU03137.1 hypothetical protein Phep_0915 [Pedobacter heparinus DSM 2366]
MIDKNILLARFWANANQFTTADGIEIDLHGDDIVVVSTTLKNTAGALREIQMMAEFALDAFLAEMEVQLLDDVMEIDLNMLFAWLIGGTAGYHIMKGNTE